MEKYLFGGAGRAYKPVTHGALPCLAPCQRHQVVMKRDDASYVWRVFYFFERGLIVRVIV